MLEFGHCMSNGTNVPTEIRGKNWYLASRVSWSLKVIGTDMDRLDTYDFLLVIRSDRAVD